MPPLRLPDNFLQEIISLHNYSADRKRRNSDPIYQFTSNFHGRVSRLKRGSDRVLTVQGQNGMDRADIYLGFILDGYKKYENINNALPDTKIVFFSPPEINSTDEVIEFYPSKDELIHVKVGCV